MKEHDWVYALVEPFTHEVRYVGCANNPLDRLRSHLRNINPHNKELSAWVKSWGAQDACPGLLILEQVPRGAAGAERERFWIQKFQSEGKNLFNKQMTIGYTRPSVEIVNGNSHAGRIRSAMERIGWSATAKEIQAEVGPVVHYLEKHNRVLVGTGRRRSWHCVENPTPALLPLSYIRQIKRNGRKGSRVIEGT